MPGVSRFIVAGNPLKMEGMPVDFGRDDAHRLVRIVLTEPFGIQDVTDVLDRQAADGVWQYGTLVDARRGILSAADSKLLLEHMANLASQHGPPGPIALVTRQGVASAQAYAIRSAQAGLRFEVFWDVEEAEDSLKGQPHKRG